MNESVCITINDREMSKESARPLVSFVIPLYKPPREWLVEMLESVLVVALKYGNSEILLHDDGSQDEELTSILADYK